MLIIHMVLLCVSDIKINNAIAYDDVIHTSNESDICYTVEVDISFLKKYMNY